jgi:hypothetical protein
MTTYGHLKYITRSGKWEVAGIPPHVAIRLKSNFPRLAKTATSPFRLGDTPDTCADLHWFSQRYPLEISTKDEARLSAGKAAFEDMRDRVEQILLPDWQPSEFTGFRDGFSLYPNQRQAVEVARTRGRLLLMDDVGLGKTVSALGTVSAPEFLPAAVIVEPHLATQWRDDFVAKFTHLRCHMIKGTKPYDLPEADVYIFRYSNIAGWVDIAAQGIFKSVVFDEIQQLRHGPATSKGKAALVFAQHATAMRMGLSATPIYNYGGEVFPIVELIEPGALGSKDEFFREWCRPGPGGKPVVKDPDALGTYLREQHIALRHVRAGRPVNTLIQEVPFDQEVADSAADLAHTLALKVMSGSFVERGQAARELDMLARQITGVAKARHVAAYVRILLEAGMPILLAGWHREVYDIWLKELREFKPVMYTGTESPAAKDRAKAAFMGGDTNLLIISLRSGAGLDGLQKRCCTAVLGELDWSPKVHEQLIGRLDRPGQESEVTAIYLPTDSGSDPLVIGMLGLKASQSRGITDPLAGVEHIHSDESRIRMLAERYIQARAA